MTSDFYSPENIRKRNATRHRTERDAWITIFSFVAVALLLSTLWLTGHLSWDNVRESRDRPLTDAERETLGRYYLNKAQEDTQQVNVKITVENAD